MTYTRLLLAALLLFGSCGLVRAANNDAPKSHDRTNGTYDQAADGERRAKTAGSSLIGQPGPDITVTTLDGKKVDLTAQYGKEPVYLKFWATWCIPCRERMPGFQKKYEKYGDQIQVIAVNTGFSDTATAARAYRKKLGLTMPLRSTTAPCGKHSTFGLRRSMCSSTAAAASPMSDIATTPIYTKRC